LCGFLILGYEYYTQRHQDCPAGCQSWFELQTNARLVCSLYFNRTDHLKLERLQNRSGALFLFVIFLALTYLRTYLHKSEWAGIEWWCSGLSTVMHAPRNRCYLLG